CLHGLVDDTVRIHVPGGELELAWDGAGEVLMTGPAAYVYAGQWPWESRLRPLSRAPEVRR
ncbi:MAG: hypothetical protein ACHQ7M_10605, partial [Chloroflexota bacterium]